MRSNWEAGVVFGQALAEIKALARGQARLEQRVDRVEAQISTARNVVTRVALILALAATAGGLNLAPETIARLLLAALKLVTSAS